MIPYRWCGRDLCNIFSLSEPYKYCYDPLPPQILRIKRKHLVGPNPYRRNYPAADSDRHKGARPGYSFNRERKAQSPIQYLLPHPEHGRAKPEKISRILYNHNHNPLNTLNVTAKENLSEIPPSLSLVEPQIGIKTLQSTRPRTRGIRFCIQNNLDACLFAAGGSTRPISGRETMLEK